MTELGEAIGTGLFTMAVGVGSILLPVLSGVPMPLEPIILLLVVGTLAFSVGFFGRYVIDAGSSSDREENNPDS